MDCPNGDIQVIWMNSAGPFEWGQYRFGDGGSLIGLTMHTLNHNLTRVK